MITLKPIKTYDEYNALLGLKVHEGQDNFVASNLESFADAFA